MGFSGRIDTTINSSVQKELRTVKKTEVEELDNST